MIAVSIVVPTRNRSRALERCLAALAAQRELEAMEMIVVDDGSVDADEISAVVNAFPAARLVRAGGAGPAAARNAGVHAARGAIVCLTDDDCEPAPDWAARLVGAIGAGADVVGGSTVNGTKGDLFVEASELIVRELQASTRRRLEGSARVFIPSNNLACRRELLLDHPFDERYPLPAGEDRAWCAAIAAAGYSLVLVPDAVVAHRPPLGLGGFWRQHVRYGRGAFQFARTAESADWREPPGFYFRLLRAGLEIGPRCLMLVTLAQVATMVGYVLEGLSRRR
jgi:glycosyltransferase involved in cell wall biosynthesis